MNAICAKKYGTEDVASNKDYHVKGPLQTNGVANNVPGQPKLQPTHQPLEQELHRIRPRVKHVRPQDQWVNVCSTTMKCKRMPTNNRHMECTHTTSQQQVHAPTRVHHRATSKVHPHPLDRIALKNERFVDSKVQSKCNLCNK